MLKHKSLISYIIGFLASLCLTLLAYFAVTLHLLTSTPLLILILLLAITQLMIQLIFFLHLGQEKKPRWNATILVITIGMILTVVVGAIWIMTHLNHNMTPREMMRYANTQSGF